MAKGFVNSNATGDADCCSPSTATGFGGGSTLNDTGVTPGTYAPAGIVVNSQGRIINAVTVPYGVPAGGLEGEALVKSSRDDFATEWAPVSGLGSVTRVDATSPENTIAIGGMPITSTGTMLLDLTATGVVAGDYSTVNLTVDAKGRITSIASSDKGVISVSLANGVGTTGIGGPITNTGTLQVNLTNTGVTAGTYALANVVVNAQGRITNISSGNVPPTGVTSVGVAAGSAAITVSGTNPITSSGTITLDLSATGVSPGFYTAANVTVDAKGRITAIANGIATGGGGSGTVTSVGISNSAAITLTGTNPITTSGTFALDLSNTGVTAGTYYPTRIVIDAKGRITTAVSQGLVDAFPSQIKMLTGWANGAQYRNTIYGLPIYAYLDSDNDFNQNSGVGFRLAPFENTSDLVDPVIGSVASGNLHKYVWSLTNTGVTAGSYTAANLTVDSKGRITAVSNGAGGGSGTVTSVGISNSAAITLSGTNPITTSGTFALDLSNTGVTSGTYTKVTVDSKGRVTAGANIATGDVTTALGFTPARQDATLTYTGDATGTGAANTSITLTLGTTGVAAGTYSTSNVVVDAKGRITSISSGAIGVSSVAISNSVDVTVTGSPITSAGTFVVGLSNTGVTAGTYTVANITVDAKGRIIAAANGSGGSSNLLSSVSISAGVLTLNMANSISAFFYGPLNANITSIVWQNVVPGVESQARLALTADGTGRSITWGSAIRWPSGVNPIPSTANNKVDIYSFVTIDGGTNIFGSPFGLTF